MKQPIVTTARLLCLTAAIAMLAQCTKDTISKNDIDLSRGPERYISMSASLPQSDNKAYIDYNASQQTHKVKWESGDKININGDELTAQYFNNDATQATFYGNVRPYSYDNQEIYWATYPSSLTVSTPASPYNSVTISLPATQDYYTNTNALSENTYMAGYTSVSQNTSSLSMQMRNLGSVLRLKLTAPATEENTHIDRLVLTSSDGHLAGTFVVACSGPTDTYIPTITYSSGDPGQLLVNLDDGTNGYIDISTEKIVYVLIPPGSKNLTLRVYNTGNWYYEKTTSTAQTFERSKIYTSDLNAISFTNYPYTFTVETSKKVVFSPGNLQYRASPSTWRFAEHQWDFVGDASNGTVSSSDNTQISSNYSGWIDLFGWGTSGYNNKYPYMTSTSNSDYYQGSLTGLTGQNYDWGVNNAIQDQNIGVTYTAGTWRTLTKAEWEYLLNQRSGQTVNNINNARYATAQLTISNCTLRGIILFPDNYSGGTPTGVTWSYINDNNSTNMQTPTTCTADGWAALEEAGCVFLPPIGERSQTGSNNQITVSWSGNQQNGHYWTSTYYQDNNAYRLSFNWQGSGGAYFTFGTAAIHNARGVRLVRDYSGN